MIHCYRSEALRHRLRSVVRGFSLFRTYSTGECFLNESTLRSFGISFEELDLGRHRLFLFLVILRKFNRLLAFQLEYLDHLLLEVVLLKDVLLLRDQLFTRVSLGKRRFLIRFSFSQRNRLRKLLMD